MDQRFSHRDRRVAREVHRSAWGMLGLVVALAVVAVVAPSTAIRFGAVVGMAAAGGATLYQSRRMIDAYLADLSALERGVALHPAARIEMHTNVGLERLTVGPTRRSPNVRRRPPGPRGTASALPPGSSSRR